jgi:hypothetical protein
MRKLISFSSGLEQSLLAVRYFKSLGSDFVCREVVKLEPTNLLVNFGENQGGEIPIRLYSQPQADRVQAAQLLKLMKSRTSKITIDSKPEEVMDLLMDLLRDSQEIDTGFMGEVYNPKMGWRDQGREFSTFVSHGVVHFASSNDLMIVQVEPDLYGVAVAGNGSYLIDVPSRR